MSTLELQAGVRASHAGTRRHAPPVTKPHLLWDGKRIPIERFASDHWHQLLVLGRYGTIARTHWSQGPTLVSDSQLHGHTDFDVLDDLVAAGLARMYMGERRPSPTGSATRQLLLEHLRAGGNYANFSGHIKTQRLLY